MNASAFSGFFTEINVYFAQQYTQPFFWNVEFLNVRSWGGEALFIVK